MNMKVIGIKKDLIYSEKKNTNYHILHVLSEDFEVEGLASDVSWVPDEQYPNGLTVNETADFQFNSGGKLISIVRAE